MGAQVFIDLTTYGIALLPPGDHATVSALACVNRACGPLFARFLQVNELIDMKTGAAWRCEALNEQNDVMINGVIVPSGPLYFQDRFHGSFQCWLTALERWILIKGVRAWVSQWRHYSSLTAMTTVRYSFGQLMSMRTPEAYWEFTTIADVPVQIVISDIRGGWLEVSLSLRHDSVLMTIFASVLSVSGCWVTHCSAPSQVCNEYDEYDEHDSRLIARVCETDLLTVLQPYKVMAVQLRRESEMQGAHII